MFAEQRQERIIHLLHQYDKVEVSSLTQILGVSEATVRRDLEKLEQDGRLQRTHGGAIRVKHEKANSSKQESRIEIPEAYRKIGKTAQRLVEQNDVIAIGSGLEGLAMAEEMPKDVPCTVITNDANILIALLKNPSLSVIMTGGLMHKTQGNLDISYSADESSLKMLEDLYVNKAFLSASGINIKAGVTIRDFAYVPVWKELYNIATETIIMAPAEVFGKREVIKLIAANEMDKIVTNAELEEEYKQYFVEHNVSVHFSFDL